MKTFNEYCLWCIDIVFENQIAKQHLSGHVHCWWEEMKIRKSEYNGDYADDICPFCATTVTLEDMYRIGRYSETHCIEQQLGIIRLGEME